MKSIGRRVISDLKADPRKTTTMIVLAVVLVVAWVWALNRGGENAPAPVASDDTQSETAPGDEGGTGTLESLSGQGLFPLILTQALPFDEIGKNPFSSHLSTLVSPGGNGSGPRKAEGGKSLAQLEEEVIRSFKLTCTVVGQEDAYALVDGVILREGDRHGRGGDAHNSFLLKEIGEGYVVFAGEAAVLRVDVKF